MYKRLLLLLLTSVPLIAMESDTIQKIDGTAAKVHQACNNHDAPNMVTYLQEVADLLHQDAGAAFLEQKCVQPIDKKRKTGTIKANKEAEFIQDLKVRTPKLIALFQDTQDNPISLEEWQILKKLFMEMLPKSE